jgi:4-hydroxybenzoate polyprenyltransferase
MVMYAEELTDDLKTRSRFKATLVSLRPLQWIKNGFILIPLLFAQEIFNPQSLASIFQAVIVFCFLSSGVYLINDLIDLEADRRHPEKSKRPLAAGELSPRAAAFMAVTLVAVSLVWSAWISAALLIIGIVYLSIQLLYSYRLKEVVIIDIFCISSGFLLRVLAGAAAIDVHVSDWLIVCTILISMLLAMGKRRHELILLGDGDAKTHRKVLSKYTPYLLDQMIGVITGSTILSYMLYCISADTIGKFGTDHLIYTVPFVLFGIFRYLYLIHQKKTGGAPEKLLISDKQLLISVVLWGCLSVAIIYGGL